MESWQEKRVELENIKFVINSGIILDELKKRVELGR